MAQNDGDVESRFGFGVPSAAQAALTWRSALRRRPLVPDSQPRDAKRLASVIVEPMVGCQSIRRSGNCERTHSMSKGIAIRAPVENGCRLPAPSGSCAPTETKSAPVSA